MDLVPKPDQLVAAAANLAQSALYGGLADLRPMASTVVDEGPRRLVRHYRPASARSAGDPVLLVSPLAAPPLCYDLRRGCSLVEHLVAGGRPTYLLEYGEVSFADRDLAIAPWVRDVVPAAVREVSRHAGGRPVHLVGWSLGGTLALLGAATDAALPIASVVVLGSPFDLGQVPLVAPPRPLVDLTAGRGALARVAQAVGVAQQPLVGWAVQQPVFQRLVTRPLALAAHLDDADYLAQLEAVERFRAQITAYRGRTYGQLYHRLLKAEALRDGVLPLPGVDGAVDRQARLADVRVPVLAVGGAADRIAPADAVKAVVPLLTGSPEARFEIVPGGHLGLLTGRSARAATWPVIDAWVDEWTARETPPGTSSKGAAPRTSAPRKAASRKAAPSKAAPSKAAPSKAAPRKAAPRKAAPRKAAPGKVAGEPAIGTDPRRRYGSASSRALGKGRADT